MDLYTRPVRIPSQEVMHILKTHGFADREYQFCHVVRHCLLDEEREVLGENFEFLDKKFELCCCICDYGRKGDDKQALEMCADSFRCSRRTYLITSSVQMLAAAATS